MKKILVAMAAAGVLSLAGASLVQAQGADTGVFKAPFRFIVGDKLLPAGSYRVTDQGQPFGVLLVEGTAKGGTAAFAATEAAENPYPNSTEVHVVFKSIDGQYFLWQVAMPGRDARRVALTKASAELALAKLNLMPAERADAGSKQ